MTLREAIDNSLRALPDEKTTKNNLEFLQNAAKKMEKMDQQKMQSVIDGIKKTDLFVKNQQEMEKQQKKQKQVEKPQMNSGNTAQTSESGATAQVPNAGATASA
jgi:hypothetical protein